MKKDMEKIAFPDVQGDVAPGALIPKACTAIQKQVTKLQGMIDACGTVPRLTLLQTRLLVFMLNNVSIRNGSNQQ